MLLMVANFVSIIIYHKLISVCWYYVAVAVDGVRGKWVWMWIRGYVYVCV